LLAHLNANLGVCSYTGSRFCHIVWSRVRNVRNDNDNDEKWGLTWLWGQIPKKDQTWHWHKHITMSYEQARQWKKST